MFPQRLFDAHLQQVVFGALSLEGVDSPESEVADKKESDPLAAWLAADVFRVGWGHAHGGQHEQRL